LSFQLQIPSLLYILRQLFFLLKFKLFLLLSEFFSLFVLHYVSLFFNFLPSSSSFKNDFSDLLKLEQKTFCKIFTIFSFFSMVSYPNSAHQHFHCCFAETAFSSCENAVKQHIVFLYCCENAPVGIVTYQQEGLFTLILK